MLTVRWFLATSLVLAATAACGDDDNTSPPDAASPPDSQVIEGPDANPCPDPNLALPYGSQWLPVDSVATTPVVNTPGTPNILTVDATAGGMSATGPYVYVAFASGDATKVSITDTQSFADSTWHIALKRYVLRVNGGDSGPGTVKVATVPATSLDQVTAPPAAGDFATDDWATPTCELVEGPLGEPVTAFGMWYSYDMSATPPIAPLPNVYVVDLGGGQYVKLRITSYYDAAQSGAHYTIEWATL